LTLGLPDREVEAVAVPESGSNKEEEVTEKVPEKVIEAVIPPQVSDDEDIIEDSPEETPVEPKPPAQKALTVDEARAIAQEWLDKYPIQEPNTLEVPYEHISENGKDYYGFFIDSWYMYWFTILVDKENGELWCRLTEDGEEPAPPEYVLLDDWYNEIFGSVG